MRPLFLRNKYHLFRDHEARLATSPRPEEARARFQARLHDAQRGQRWKTAAYVGASMTLITAVASSLAVGVEGLEPLIDVLVFIAGITSGLTILFAVTILVANRWLSLVDVELYFYALESRIPLPPGGGSTE